MGNAEDLLTAALMVVDIYGDGAETYLTNRIATARSANDGRAADRWEEVKRIVEAQLREGAPTDAVASRPRTGSSSR